MRTLAIILGVIFLFLVGCGTDNNAVIYKTPEPCTVEGYTVTCPDGTTVTLPEPEDGVDAVLLTTVDISNYLTCSQIYPGIWAQNLIDDGEVFDVYYNDTCDDHLGEYCDNIKYSDEDQAGQVCWVDNLQISGSRVFGTDTVRIRILDFNGD